MCFSLATKTINLTLCVVINIFFLFLIVEQFPCQQSRETAGPEIYSRPPHQYHFLQNEGALTC